MAKVKLGKNSPSQVSESYSSQLYRITQVNQDMKVLFVLRKKSYSKELIISAWIGVFWKGGENE